MKSLMIICALLVCQVQSASYDPQSEKLEKSQEITRCLRCLQKNYQEGCDFNYALRQYIHQLDVNVLRLASFAAAYPDIQCDHIISYIDWMYRLRTDTQSFFKQYCVLNDEEEKCFSTICYHRKADWGAFPNPTRRRKPINLYIYFCRIFKRPAFSCKSHLEAFSGVMTHLAKLRDWQEGQKNLLPSLQKAINAISDDDGCIAQSYKEGALKAISSYEECLQNQDSLVQALRQFGPSDTQMLEFSDAEKMLSDLFRSEQVMQMIASR
ncbi:MAG: hypothetical protein OXC30_01195 [Alphaproteobacteria bacterium]|nr:hypothetical protein [Alphaproteobacteria bacterium]